MQLEVPSSQVPEVASSQDIPASEGAEDVGSSGEEAAASAVQEKLPEADKATEEPDSPEDQQSEPLTAGDAPEILHAQNMSPEDSGQEGKADLVDDFNDWQSLTQGCGPISRTSPKRCHLPRDARNRSQGAFTGAST